MMGKFVPTALILCGATCFLVTIVRGNIPGGIFTAGLISYSTIGLYIIVRSYFFGYQKGHMFHALQVIVYAIFGLLSLLFSYRLLPLGVVFPAMLAIFVVLAVVLSQYYKQIHDDFRNGIKRNYFKRGGF